jgi:hypothetical protein
MAIATIPFHFSPADLHLQHVGRERRLLRCPSDQDQASRVRNTWLRSPGVGEGGSEEVVTVSRTPAASLSSPEGRSLPPIPRLALRLRVVRGWLIPATTLKRRWQAWAQSTPLAEFQHLLDTVTAGYRLFVYLSPLANGLALDFIDYADDGSHVACCITSLRKCRKCNF